MPLKTFVKVGAISNLSDARYCAGMGVDMLGFNVMEGQNSYVAPKAFQEIRGWVSGPSIVAEMYGFTEATDFAAIIENYAPDYIEVYAGQLTLLPESISVPIIIGLTEASIHVMQETIDLWKDRTAFLLVTEINPPLEFIQLLADKYTTVVTITAQDPNMLITESKIKGIALNGNKELKPGLKDYDHLSTVLDQLDVD